VRRPSRTKKRALWNHRHLQTDDVVLASESHSTCVFKSRD
jgi:hypothetical protein